MTRPAPMPLILANLALLALYPVAWAAPLMRAGWLPFFAGEEITLLSGINELWQADAALALLVALFALAIPYAKTLALAAIHLGHLGPRTLPAIEFVGRLSMTDVFLVALYIIAVKGVGIGYVTAAWGLWLFTACVLASLAVAFATSRRLSAGEG